MLEVKIDGILYKVPNNLSILQVCLENGINVPNFCYHERLHIAGNCRMCLVEVKNLPKPIESCTMQIQNNMTIFTQTPFVKKAQENIIESLLYLHPLDCPICDQGGECDLQEQTQQFGSDRGRFYKARRGVLDKNCGFFIKTVMTRCIHCTRCVRFSEEIANDPYFGTLSRGTNTEIAFFKLKPFRSEISGNVIDLCPVGALTSKPHAFETRPWEETIEFESIDVLDPLASSIFISSTNTKVLKILPRINNRVNKEWISDRIRFCYDSLGYNRLKNIFIKDSKKYSKFNWVTFEKKVSVSKQNFFSNFPLFYLSSTVSDLKFFIEIFNISLISNKEKNFFRSSFFFSNFSFLNRDLRSNFIDSFILDDLFKYDSFMIFEFNLKEDFPIYNAYLNIAQKNNSSSIFFFGNSFKFNFNGYHIGSHFNTFFNFFKGTHFLSRKFLNKKNCLFLNQILLSDNFFKENIFVKNFIDYFKNLINFYPFLNHNFYLEKNSFFSSSNDSSLIEIGYFLNQKKIFETNQFYTLNKNLLFNKNSKINFFSSFCDLKNFEKNNIFLHFFSNIYKDSSLYFLNSSKIIFYNSHGFLDLKKVIEPYILFPLSSFYESYEKDLFLYFGYSSKKTFYGCAQDNYLLTELYFLNLNLKQVNSFQSKKKEIILKENKNIDFNLDFSFKIKDIRFYLLNNNFFFLSCNNFGLKSTNSFLLEENFVKNSKNLMKSSSMFLKLPFNL